MVKFNPIASTRRQNNVVTTFFKVLTSYQGPNNVVLSSCVGIPPLGRLLKSEFPGTGGTANWLIFLCFIGLVGVGCIAFGIGSGFGLVMLTGQYYVAFVGTLPFLVLGVGIDDMFIMLDGKFGHVYINHSGIHTFTTAFCFMFTIQSFSYKIQTRIIWHFDI